MHVCVLLQPMAAALPWKHTLYAMHSGGPIGQQTIQHMCVSPPNLILSW